MLIQILQAHLRVLVYAAPFILSKSTKNCKVGFDFKFKSIIENMINCIGT